MVLRGPIPLRSSIRRRRHRDVVPVQNPMRRDRHVSPRRRRFPRFAFFDIGNRVFRMGDFLRHPLPRGDPPGLRVARYRFSWMVPRDGGRVARQKNHEKKQEQYSRDEAGSRHLYGFGVFPNVGTPHRIGHILPILWPLYLTRTRLPCNHRPIRLINGWQDRKALLSKMLPIPIRFRNGPTSSGRQSPPWRPAYPRRISPR